MNSRSLNWLCLVIWGGLLFPLVSPPAQAQLVPTSLFTNLQALVNQVPTGDSDKLTDGPKGIANGDIDGDGSLDLVISDTDGKVTVYFGNGEGRFRDPQYLDTRTSTLRGIVCADLNGDGWADIVTAYPGKNSPPEDGALFIFFSQGPLRAFAGTQLQTWPGARNLVAADFDGDGIVDLAVAGRGQGLRQYKGTGGGSFQVVANLAELAVGAGEGGGFPKPVYSMRAIGRDLVVTHADTLTVWTLSANGSGVLEVVNQLTSSAPAHALAVAPIFHPADSGIDDLVLAQRDDDRLEIYAGTDRLEFDRTAREKLHGLQDPRAVEVIDLNGDGWNDLVVVLRNLDIVLTFENVGGTLKATAERPVGFSPREMTVGRFDDDLLPDVAVMNRDSSDVTILIAAPEQVGFTALDHLYLVEGNIAGLAVLDFNPDVDDNDDVIQLHRASGDFSVWLARADGTLMPPVYYTIGNVPGSQVIHDVNGDGVPDVVAANLESAGVERSSVTVRLGDGAGGFGAIMRFALPEDQQGEGRLFALVPVELDGDGLIDLAAGFLDSRIAFFRNTGREGNEMFEFTRIHRFVTLARGLVAGNFDGDEADQFLDIAGVGVSGEVWVVRNNGDLLTAPSLTNVLVYPPAASNVLARTIKVAHLNGDTDPDLLVGGGGGAFLYAGSTGVEFAPPVQLGTNSFPVSDMVTNDFDGDGLDDVVVTCRVLPCVSLFVQTPAGGLAPALTFEVPASKFIASGDLDNDGAPDLVGSGSVLWTALSGRPPQLRPPLERTERPILEQVVINEFLARNTSLPVELDGDRTTDWIELFNGGSSVSLRNWRLEATERAADGGLITREFKFPSTAFLPSKGHLLLHATESTNRSLYSTAWKLPGGGGTLSIIDINGQVVDRVEYPPQQENISFARFRDGVSAFVFHPLPSPAEPNPVFAKIDPGFRFEGVDPATFLPGPHAVRFLASIRPDVTVAGLQLFYQLGYGNSAPQAFPFVDDGLHGDGGMFDNLFAGDLLGGLAANVPIQFYFEVTDIDDITIQIPEDPEFYKSAQEEGEAFRLVVTPRSLQIEISELVALNENGLRDDTEKSGTPDWVEVRCIGTEPVSLDGIVLTRGLGDGSTYEFPEGTVLNPGEYFVVFCDDDPSQGALHAPFSLRRTGDQVMLTGVMDGARTLLDAVVFGQLEADQAYARVGAGGSWYTTFSPSPFDRNLFSRREGPGMMLFTLPTFQGVMNRLEFSSDLGLTPWEPIPGVEDFWGDGTEALFEVPASGPAGYFRMVVP